MAETVNRTVLISGYDDGLVELFKKIEEAGTEAYSALSEAANKHTEAIGKMVEKMQQMMDKQAEQQKKMDGSGGGGSGSGGGWGGGIMGGVGAGFGAGLGIASFQSVGAMIGTGFTEGRKLDEAIRMIYSLTGADDSKPNAMAGVDIGYTASSLLENQANMIRSAGMGIEGAEGASLRSLQIERRMGLGEGSSIGLNQFARQGGGTSDQIMSKFLVRAAGSKLWDIDVNGEGVINGFPALGEKLQTFTSLTSNFLNVKEGADTDGVLRVMAGLGSLGGQFKDQRAESSIMAIHDALSNPANSFVAGDMTAAYMDDNPFLTQFQLKKKVQRGAADPENVEVYLKWLQAEFPNMENRLNAIEVFTKGKLTEEGVRRLSQDDVYKTIAESPDQKKTIDDVIGEGGLYGQSKKATGIYGQTESASVGTLAEGGLAALTLLGQPLQEMLKSFNKFLEDPTKAIDEAIHELGVKIDEAIAGLGKGIKEWLNPTSTTQDEKAKKSLERQATSVQERKALEAEYAAQIEKLSDPNITKFELFVAALTGNTAGLYAQIEAHKTMEARLAEDAKVYAENAKKLEENTRALEAKSKAEAEANKVKKETTE